MLNRNFTVNSLGEVWVSDLTYLKTKEGWLYLTVVIDLFDRKVIGRELSSTMKVIERSIAALEMALSNRNKSENLIFHFDRGVQYTCSDFTEIMAKKKITQGMSRKGNCWDNPVAESFFKTVKTENIYSIILNQKEKQE